MPTYPSNLKHLTDLAAGSASAADADRIAAEAARDALFGDLASSAAGKGAALVEYQGGTVDGALDARLPELGNYAALDAYNGPVNSGVYLRGYANIFDGGHGIFRPATDTPAAANGIYRKDALNRWWKRDFSGPASVLWFRVKGDGIEDDTAAIVAALAAADHVVVPEGMTPLISSTITVAAGKKLEFGGSYGNPVVPPGSYCIKKSTMTTAAIRLNQAATMIGGGVVCQPGNTGDGIVLAQNAAKALWPFVDGAGGVGIRVGTDAGDNSNSTELHQPVAVRCGSYGIYVHDGFGHDANAGIIYSPRCIQNGGDGIRLGHCYWVTVINGNSEINAGYGLYLSGNNNSGYPECRWANIVGGDYNEGNTAGAVFDASYYASISNPDAFNFPTTLPNGLQGSGLRTCVGHQQSIFPSIKTTLTSNELTTNNQALPPLVVGTVGSGSVGDGPVVQFRLSQDGGTSYKTTASIKSYQLASTSDAIAFSANLAGSLTRIAMVSGYYNGITPASDNAINLGHSALRWGTVYAGTGTISTSDKREKQDIEPLDEAERKVAKRLKKLVKKFRFRDAVVDKGDAARIHFGVIAQEVKAAFEAEGLDAERYAIICYDEWEETPEIVDSWEDEFDGDGNLVRAAGSRVIQEYIPPGDRYGVRYDELLAFIISAM